MHSIEDLIIICVCMDIGVCKQKADKDGKGEGGEFKTGRNVQKSFMDHPRASVWGLGE